MKLEHDTLSYLEEIFGVRPELVALEQGRLRGLPVFLLNVYRFVECNLLGKKLVFALPYEEKDGEADSTPAELAKKVARLQECFGLPVALLLPRVEAYQRNRLVQMGVSFIVPRRQLFLPQLMIDLREQFPRVAKKSVKKLSAPAQVVILYHLQVQTVGGFSLRELARRTGYSAMTLTNVQDELVACGFCETEQIGRSKYLRFKSEGQQLWKNALPFLASPVRSVRPVKIINPRLLPMKSGMSALAEYTQINPDRIPVFALKESVLLHALEDGDVRDAFDRDDASAMLELWAYDPRFMYLTASEISTYDPNLERNQIVDKLSLYLSLKDDPDERVQGELDDLMEQRTW